MAIPTSRTKTAAVVALNHDVCTGCGLCVSVCKNFGLQLENGKAKLADSTLLGCIGCGHCMAICPTGAVEVRGRMLTPEDIFSVSTQNAATYEQLFAMLQQRRSIREFLDAPVKTHLIEKILDAAQTAPMGVPPSDVNVLVLNGREKGRSFVQDFCECVRSSRWMTSSLFLAVMRPFWGKKNDELFRNFIKPMLAAFTSSLNEGADIITYDAPLIMYFYGSPYADPADPVIAATYAILSAESLGLGACMIGSIHPLIQYGRKARQFRQKYGIKYTSKEGMCVVFGYPAVVYSKGIKRTFASITYV